MDQREVVTQESQAQAKGCFDEGKRAFVAHGKAAMNPYQPDTLEHFFFDDGMAAYDNDAVSDVVVKSPYVPKDFDHMLQKMRDAIAHDGDPAHPLEIVAMHVSIKQTPVARNSLPLVMMRIRLRGGRTEAVTFCDAFASSMPPSFMEFLPTDDTVLEDGVFVNAITEEQMNELTDRGVTEMSVRDLSKLMGVHGGVEQHAPVDVRELREALEAAINILAGSDSSHVAAAADAPPPPPLH